MPVPLLILSDAPTAGTGLGRITKDLAVRIAEYLPNFFRVATLGYGGPYSSKLPFHQYAIDMQDWVVTNLQEVWEDFAGEERGIVMSIWDASRMLWFSRPETCVDPRLRKFLTTAPFEKWGYFPIDATGPHDKLTTILGHTIEGYDRVLCYSKWAEDIVRRTLPASPILDGLTNLPHGIETDVFQPRNRTVARHGFGERIGARTQKGKWLSVPDDALMIGIVATNQARKDYGLGVATVAELAKDRNVLLWIHTDVLERNWSIPALIYDFELIDKTVVTTVPFTDEQMSWCYSACDVTLGIGLGEGFGYPIFESLACGTPCIHGDYGGAAEHMSDEGLILVGPHEVRLEGAYNCERPVYRPYDWARLTEHRSKDRLSLPAHLNWNNLWPRWSEWLQRGIK